MEPLYNFPLIAQDLQQEDYVIQIADALQYLTDVTDDIFQRINNRIDKNVSHTKDILVRVETCRQKVEKLTNSNKATKVLSGSKYPAMGCFKNYETIFASEPNQVSIYRNTRDIKSKIRGFDNGNLQDKLEFYHVKVDSPDLYKWLSENQPNIGLGNIPAQVKHINSLLLFNSKDLIYAQEKAGDGQLQSSKSVPIHVEDKQEASLPDAPFSISNREQLSKKVADSYLYSPGMGEVPIMDVPLDLPHLSGVADDMQFSFETDIIIAPSAILTPPVCNEVDSNVVKLEDDPPVKKLESEKAETVPKDMEKPIETLSAMPKVVPPPPPPPPPPPAPAPPQEDISEPDSQTESRSSSSKKTAKKAATAVSDDGRANLMEAIRRAGGSGKAKLRPATLDIVEETKKPSGGNDLMADLHAKLSMRRKGISGDRAKTDGSILGVISAMIPPPVTKSTDQISNTETSSADEDWD